MKITRLDKEKGGNINELVDKVNEIVDWIEEHEKYEHK